MKLSPTMKKAIRCSGGDGRVCGPTARALERRGLARSVWVEGIRGSPDNGYHDIPGHMRYTLTPAGFALKADMFRREEELAQMEREALGTVEVPVWALREILGRDLAGKEPDFHKALTKALEDR